MKDPNEPQEHHDSPGTRYLDEEGLKDWASRHRARRVLIAAWSEEERGRLRSMLEAIDEHEIVGEALDGLQAYELGLTLRPDAIVMAPPFPLLSAGDAARRLEDEVPGVKVLLVVQKADLEMPA